MFVFTRTIQYTLIMVLGNSDNQHMDKMMTSLRKLVFWGALLVAFPAVSADVMYQCVDEHGNKTFSNIKPSMKNANCKAMDLGPSIPTTSSPSGSGAKTPSPSSFPKVGEDAQKARDNDRRRILEGELDAERKNLENAKKDLAEQEATRHGNERNYQKVLDRLEPYKNKVDLHERNIESIQRELSKIR